VTYEFDDVALRDKLEAVGVTLGVDLAIGYRFPLLQSENLYPLGVLLATPQGFEALIGGVYKPVSTPESEQLFIEHFREALSPVMETFSPDCKEGKHRACDGRAWDFENDHGCSCTCDCHKERVAE
jgi:hypothetical protein